MTEQIARRQPVRGTEIEIRTLGSGRNLLFLHPGSGLRNHDMFLQRLAAEFHVVAPSHPGFGASELPNEFTTVDDLAYFYLDLLEDLDLNDVILVGASFGGWIAAELAIKCTSRLSALVLISPLGIKCGDRRTRDITDLFAYPAYEQDGFLYRDEAMRRRTYGDMPQEQLLETARNFESFAMFGWSPTLFDPKLRQRLSRVHLPTLVLCGDSDAVVPARYGMEYAGQIPGAHAAIIANAGHYLHIDQMDATVSSINAFLGELPGRIDRAA